jgi:L-ascorbate metabolism protein UlaG (beta-lactamase superfamily)
MYDKKSFPIFKNNRFGNPIGDIQNYNNRLIVWNYIKTFHSAIKWALEEFSLFESTKISTFLKNQKKDITIIPMGHASVLIGYRNKFIIFDPIFFSPFWFVKRYISPIPNYKTLPPIDHVIISHNHPDHFNKKSIKYLKKKSKGISLHLPLGMSSCLDNSYKKNEYSWWEEKIISKSNPFIKLTSLPAIHWSQGGLSGKNKSLWCSWMLQIENKKIYFAGDTAYWQHFKEIKNEFGPTDIAILPVAPCFPENQRLSHLNPDDAYKAFVDLDAQCMIPIHWGVFNYGPESRVYPINEIKRIMDNNGKLSQLMCAKIGECSKISPIAIEKEKEKIVVDSR